MRKIKPAGMHPHELEAEAPEDALPPRLWKRPRSYGKGNRNPKLRHLGAQYEGH